MPERDQIIRTFVDGTAWHGAERSPLAGDASFRRYDRLRKDDQQAVLMDAPPPQEDVRPFVQIAKHLTGLGFSAPRILAEDADAGLLILEDLGDDTYTKVLAEARAPEHGLYALAVDVLIDLHNRPGGDVIPDSLAPYDADLLIDEASLLTDWYLPAVREVDTASNLRQAYVDAWRQVLTPVLISAPTLVLRDYHVDNLIWLPDRDGVRACGLLDFQDAVAGPPAYDLMSLLEDARRDIDPSLIGAMLARYRKAMPEAAWDDFETVYAILAVQRHAKVIGIFTRLCLRDAKPDYLVHIPRVWRLLESHLGHPALAPVRNWFETHISTKERGIPKCRVAET